MGPVQTRYCWRIRAGIGRVAIMAPRPCCGTRRTSGERAVSLRAEQIGVVPEETCRVARAAFPRGTPYVRLRDELGTIYEDAAFARLFPERGQPAEAPWRLALVSVLQYAEGLSDRQA